MKTQDQTLLYVHDNQVSPISDSFDGILIIYSHCYRKSTNGERNR